MRRSLRRQSRMSGVMALCVSRVRKQVTCEKDGHVGAHRLRGSSFSSGCLRVRILRGV